MKAAFASALLSASAFAITGIDVSTYVGQSDFACMKNENNHEFGIPEWASVRAYTSAGYVDENAPATIHNAKEAGMKHVSAYIFPCVPCGDGGGQVNSTVYFLHHTGAEPDMYWYDVERFHWSTNIYANREFIADMIKEGKSLGIKAGIYTNYYNWEEIVGIEWTYPADQGMPLWYAHYDYYGDFKDFDPFGGWKEPAVKQYAGDVHSCGVSVDMNYISSMSALGLADKEPAPSKKPAKEAKKANESYDEFYNQFLQ